MAKQELDKFHFKVFLDKKEILKPICLGYQRFKDAKWEFPAKSVSPQQFDVIPIMSSPGARFKFYGYIYNQSKQIQPSSLRGILLRINHIGIKGYSKSLFEFTKNIGPMLPQISGEVFLGPSFEEVLTLDKDDFKEDHPLFKELIGYIHNAIDEIADLSRKRSSKIKTKKKEVIKIKDLDLFSKEIKKAQEIIGRRKFKKEYFPNIDAVIKTVIKNFKIRINGSIGKTLDPDEANYLIESLDCFDSSCFRSAVIMAWNTGMFRIHRKIEKDIGWVLLNQKIAIAPQNRGTLKPCLSIEDLRECSESRIYQLLPDLGLMDTTTTKLFYQSLKKMRDNCAHPSGYRALNGEALVMIQSVWERILKNQKFKIIP
jgi:hypothetical protein